MYSLWTEHEHEHELSKDGELGSAMIKNAPVSAEITKLKPGLILTGCMSEPTCFVLRGVYEDHLLAKKDLDELHRLGWKDWLSKR